MEVREERQDNARDTRNALTSQTVTRYQGKSVRSKQVGTKVLPVSYRVGLRVYDPGSIPSLTHSRLVRTRLSAHNASQQRYRSQFP